MSIYTANSAFTWQIDVYTAWFLWTTV